MGGMQHWINKADLRSTDWHSTPETELAAGQVRLKLDAFALTANNVTYAAFGGAPMFYWNFFPASDQGQGRVPVWGFATVEKSNADGIAEGKRVYGYFPISDTLDVEPIRVSDRGFADGAAHRQELAPIYNTYFFNDADPGYQAEYEDQQMLFRPLYTTGWMIVDSLVEGSPKVDAAIISSASSKTALATAHGLHRRGIKTIGVTSAGNVDFVKKSGLYSDVLTYDAITDLKPEGTMAYVDFVGRPKLTMDIHKTCGENLGRSMVIGVTDWEADRTPQAGLPGPVPEFFFVPDYAANRSKELPQGELDKRLGGDLMAFYPLSKSFVTPETMTGQDAIVKAWRDTVDGNITPDRGLICKL
ncbi:MAG: DUF2855 family protein [Henriciella sp.]|nr:DUF2855 family protein [Henriciella sp.]